MRERGSRLRFGREECRHLRIDGLNDLHLFQFLWHFSSGWATRRIEGLRDSMSRGMGYMRVCTGPERNIGEAVRYVECPRIHPAQGHSFVPAIVDLAIQSRGHRSYKMLGFGGRRVMEKDDDVGAP